MNQKIIQLPKTFCPFCKGHNFKIDTTFEKTDMCEKCLETLIKVQLIKMRKI